MRKYAYVAFLVSVVALGGCGAVKELVPAVQEGFEKHGPPPAVEVGGKPVEYVDLISYLLNVGLGSWAAYERRKRVNGDKANSGGK